ncbi:MAG: ImmA/IrrE family metallo-endopeptidase [Alicyclobacillaceae bacterium]|nr:ImmA/IrrE family metallo-endopeptidase [Alicyclobacillaceae bacterium]
MQISQVIETAELLAKKHGTKDPFALCDALEIDVVEKDLPSSLFGLAYSPLGYRYVVLRPNLEAPFRDFVCAHELGHHLLHPHVVTFFIEENTLFHTGKFEWEAHLFSIRLLTWGEAQHWSLSALAELGVPPKVALRFAENANAYFPYFTKGVESWQAGELQNAAINGLM